MNTSLLTRVQDLLREMNYATRGNRPLDVTTIPPHSLYDVICAAARCIAGQSGADESIVLHALIEYAFPYDHSVWMPIDEATGPLARGMGWLRHAWGGPVEGPLRRVRGRWLGLPQRYVVHPLPGDLWRPLSEQEIRNYHETEVFE